MSNLILAIAIIILILYFFVVAKGFRIKNSNSAQHHSDKNKFINGHAQNGTHYESSNTGINLKTRKTEYQK